MLPILALLADASWLMTVAEKYRGRRDVGYLLSAGVPMAVGWIGGTAVGHVLQFAPKGPLAVAAAFLSLAYIVTMLPTQWRGWRSVPSWTLSATLGGFTAIIVDQGWAMLVGGGLSTLVDAMRGDDARRAGSRRNVSKSTGLGTSEQTAA